MGRRQIQGGGPGSQIKPGSITDLEIDPNAAILRRYQIPGQEGEPGEDGLSIPGPSGPAGALGATGATGGTGPTGPTGGTGSTGATGATGTAGVVGTPGLFGAPGIAGEDGEDAPIIPGPAGAAGATGPTGATGATGGAGGAGATGATGAVGAQGVPGAPGDDGEDAPIIPGPVGAPGVAGATGAPGSAGATGAAGSAGAAGVQGIGIPGQDGEDADTFIVPGPQGPAGARGLQGFPGQDGEDADSSGPLGASIPLPVPIALGGTGQATALAARGSSGLNIERVTVRGDSDYTILATDRFVYANNPFSVPRTWTLPAANTVNAGSVIVVGDYVRGITPSNTLTIACYAGDNVNTTATFVISSTGAKVTLTSDGGTTWFAAISNSMFQTLGPTNTRRTYTFPDANATIARTDAGQTLTGNQVIVTGTSGIGLDVQQSATFVSQAKSFHVRNSNSAGQASFYFENDRGSFASYGGCLYGGTGMNSGNTLFGATRDDKLFLFADGASNLGVYIGTLAAQPLIFGTNNAENVRISSGGNVGIGMTATHQFQISTDDASKPTTNLWTITSDRRIKKKIRPYKDGLNVIEKIRPVWYQLNGRGGFKADGVDNVGVIADEMKKIAPYTVRSHMGKLRPRDKRKVKILDYQGHAITFALINAVKELSKKNKALESRLARIEKRGNKKERW